MLKRAFPLLLFSLTLLVTWELAARHFSHFLFILPAPSEVGAALIELRGRFFLHTTATLMEMLGGFFLATAAAFPLGWLMIRLPSTRSVLQPLFIVIQCLPMFTLAPIMVLWFGWGYTAIAIPTALMIFFPLTLNIYQGLKSTPPEMLEFFEANEATAWQTFIKLRLPWALPHIFAGFRISAAIAGVGAIAGEWAGAQRGLGILMLESRRNTDLEITFGALFCLTLISSAFYLLALLLERVVAHPFRWRTFFSKKNPCRLPVRKRRFALPFLLFALLVILLPGCKEPEGQKTRLILDWLPNPNHVPLYVGLEKGFFREEGIELDIQKMQDQGGGISYLTSGQADLLINHMPAALKASARGAELKLVGLLIKEPLRCFLYRSEIDPKNLSEKTLGYCIGGPDTHFLDFLLEQGEISPQARKNVSIDLVSAMGTHAVDFIYGGFWNIEPAQLRALGVETSSIPIQEFGVPPYYEIVILAQAGTRESSSDFVAAFQRALQRSIDFCFQNPDAAFICYCEYNLDWRAKTLAWQREAWHTTVPLLAKNQDIDEDEINTFVRWLESQGIIKNSFSIYDLISYN